MLCLFFSCSSKSISPACPARNPIFWSTRKYSSERKRLLNASYNKTTISFSRGEKKSCLNAVFGAEAAVWIQRRSYLCRYRWCHGSIIWIIRTHRYVVYPSKIREWHDFKIPVGNGFWLWLCFNGYAIILLHFCWRHHSKSRNIMWHNNTKRLTDWIHLIKDWVPHNGNGSGNNRFRGVIYPG